jgi:integrase
MGHLKISTKSTERKRRPTDKRIADLCDYLDEHSSLPMRDIIHFAIESAMRVEEITLLRWVDLNEHDRTIIIRNRKHPREWSATTRKSRCSAAPSTSCEYSLS